MNIICPVKGHTPAPVYGFRSCEETGETYCLVCKVEVVKDTNGEWISYDEAMKRL